LRDAMMEMAQRMAASYSGDADKDFGSGTIPGHEGAIDMAKIELQYGPDPQLRKLARDIVVARQKEIAIMQARQSKRAK
jgi:uncharacterized protein (DUF305 family)